MKEFQGDLKAQGKRFAIVASRFNDFIVEHLVRGAAGMLQKLGAEADAISVFYVPGAFEIPPVALRAARSGKFHAVLCLGAVIRGATPHFEYVAGESAEGIAQAARECPVRIIYAVLTAATTRHAALRCRTQGGDHGGD